VICLKRGDHGGAGSRCASGKDKVGREEQRRYGAVDSTHIEARLPAGTQ
jgi:hypothetical protein